jgi:hypothetical protein
MIAINAHITEFMLDPGMVQVEGQKHAIEQLAIEIDQRGLGTSRLALEIVRGTLAQKEGKVSEAEEYYKRVRDFGQERSHIWIELYGYQYLLGLYPPGSAEHSECRRQAREVKEILRERCTLPPLRRLYSNFRKNLDI